PSSCARRTSGCGSSARVTAARRPRPERRAPSCRARRSTQAPSRARDDKPALRAGRDRLVRLALGHGDSGHAALVEGNHGQGARRQVGQKSHGRGATEGGIQPHGFLPALRGTPKDLNICICERWGVNMRRALVLILTVAAGVPAAAEVRLLMVEQPGCALCARRDAGIAPIYPRMPEGQAAAPERVQLKGPYPANVALGPTPVFT